MAPATEQSAVNKLQQHMTATYFSLRVGLWALAILFPVLLYSLGRVLSGDRLQCSMSAYYWVDGTRNVFVAVLCAVAFALWAYKGFTSIENWVLNAAGVFAVGIAMFPTTAGCVSNGPPAIWHVTFAVLFFLCIAYVAIFRADDTVELLRKEGHGGKVKKFKAAYKVLGYAMIVLPLIGVGLAVWWQRPGEFSTKVFFAELGAVYAFALYWMVKSGEMALSQAERKAVKGELHPRTPVTTGLNSLRKPFLPHPIE